MTIEEFKSSTETHVHHLNRFLMKHLKDQAKVEDIMQDTYKKLWENLSDVPSTNAKSYLFTIAYNGMVDLIRRESKQVNMDELNEEEMYEMSDLGQYSDRKEIMLKALERLPERQKSAIMLRDYEAYSYEEIAKIMKIEPEVVKSYVFRARKNLRKYVVSPDNV